MVLPAGVHLEVALGATVCPWSWLIGNEDLIFAREYNIWAFNIVLGKRETLPLSVRDIPNVIKVLSFTRQVLERSGPANGIGYQFEI